MWHLDFLVSCVVVACKRFSTTFGQNPFLDWGSTPLESIMLYNFNWASTTHQQGWVLHHHHIVILMLITFSYIMLGLCSFASWQHYKNKHYDGGSVIPCFENFQLLEDCDHNVDKLGAHMKPLFGPTWRELLYKEAKGVILATLLYWSSIVLQFNVLNFLAKTLFHYL